MAAFPYQRCTESTELSGAGCIEVSAAGAVEETSGRKRAQGLKYLVCRTSGSVLNAILTEKPYQPRMWIDRSGNKLGVLAESRPLGRGNRKA